MVTQERKSEQTGHSPEAFIEAGKVDKVMEKLFLSHEERVNLVGSLIKRAFELLKGFHSEQERNIAELRENLAKDASLRKKDFDLIMSKILNVRRKKEAEVKSAIDSFMAEKEELIKDLRRRILKGWGSKDFADLKEEIGSRQRVRETEISKILLIFQNEEEELGLALRRLLDKEKPLKVKDFKNTLHLLDQQNSSRNKDLEELFEAIGDLRESINKDWRGLRLTLKSGSPLSP